jgi:hypothetical protein
LTTWKAERRITRGTGDTEKKEPRALHKAAWVHVCTAADRVGTKAINAWCGKRHATAAEASSHADQLNADPVASEKIRQAVQARARRKRAA